MQSFIKRDYSKTEDEDFQLNVLANGDNTKEYAPVYHFTNNYIVGWMLQTKYE
jgi:hypothetical protein